jgi:hypothetical protein
MCTAYLNNAGLKTGPHFRTVLNSFFDVREMPAILRRDGTTPAERRLARAYLEDIFSFKNIISNVGSFEETKTRMAEIEGLGPEYVEAFYFFGPWLEEVGTVPRGGGIVVSIGMGRFGMRSRQQNRCTRCIIWRY